MKLAQPQQVGRNEIVSVCRLCGTRGRLLYHDLSDRLYDVAGSYAFQRCSACEFIWLSPRPQREELVGCYPLSYEAHEPPVPPMYRRTSNLRNLLRGLILSEAYGYSRFRQERLVGCSGRETVGEDSSAGWPKPVLGMTISVPHLSQVALVSTSGVGLVTI